jgi:hypothetical protein
MVFYKEVGLCSKSLAQFVTPVAVTQKAVRRAAAVADGR